MGVESVPDLIRPARQRWESIPAHIRQRLPGQRLVRPLPSRNDDYQFQWLHQGWRLTAGWQVCRMPRRRGTGGRGLVTRSSIIPRHHRPRRHPVGRQRVPLEPQQAHTPGLLSGQDRLDDGGLQQRQAQQLIDRGVVQSFPLCDLTAAADHAVSEQLLPVRPRSCATLAVAEAVSPVAAGCWLLPLDADLLVDRKGR